MISILKFITKNFFGENFYNLIKNKILSFLEYSNFKKRSYNYKEDLNYNENILLKIFKNFNRARINEILLKINYYIMTINILALSFICLF